jgi:predicted nucleotidyltransferase
MFDREYLKREMEKLDGLLRDRVNIYIIGGGAMSFQNLKDATKDIDVIVGSGIEMEQLGDALARMDYFVPAIRVPYKKMQASLIMENQDGFRWDIFVNVVCGGLRLSNSMMDRALTLFSMDRLSVHMFSLEDIFVFKSVTSRERDREDMYLLFLQGLDFDVIRNEIIRQN